MISTLIVDDEIENIALMEYLIENHCKQLKVVGSASSIKDAQTLLTKENPQLLLLDIELRNGETGFDLLRSIQSWNKKPFVVFITAHDHFALKALKFHAFDYLLKPISIPDLIKTINDVEIAIEQDVSQDIQTVIETSENVSKEIVNKEFLAISHLNNIQLVKRKDIIYIRATGKYSEIYLIDGKVIISSRNLGEYEVQLENNFLRVHHSYIVNITHLQQIEKEYSWMCILTTGIKIPIARRKKTLVYEAFQLGR